VASPGPANRDCRRDDSQFPDSGQRPGEVWQNPNPDRLVRILFIQFQAGADSFVALSKMRGWLRSEPFPKLSFRCLGERSLYERVHSFGIGARAGSRHNLRPLVEVVHVSSRVDTHAVPGR
jgi:hypothetical protein